MTARAFLISTPPFHPDAEKRQPPRQVPVDAVVMFIASDKYVDAYYADGSSLMLDDLKENTIKALTAEYGDEFVEVRRGCLVRRSEIRSVRVVENSTSELVMACDMRVPVSRRKLPTVRRVVREHREAIQERARSQVSEYEGGEHVSNV